VDGDFVFVFLSGHFVQIVRLHISQQVNCNQNILTRTDKNGEIVFSFLERDLLHEKTLKKETDCDE